MITAKELQHGITKIPGFGKEWEKDVEKWTPNFEKGVPEFLLWVMLFFGLKVAP